MSFDSNPNVQEVRVEKNPSRETTLRESLSGYAKDSELQETLIRCGLAMNNLDAPSSPASALNRCGTSWLHGYLTNIMAFTHNALRIVSKTEYMFSVLV